MDGLFGFIRSVKRVLELKLMILKVLPGHVTPASHHC